MSKAIKKENKKDIWIQSPFFKDKQSVLVDYDAKDGGSYYDIEKGYYSNDYPLNYKMNPNFNIDVYEAKFPTLYKKVRFDDGTRYWYPASLNTLDTMLFLAGTVEKPVWCVAPIKPLTEEEYKKHSTDVEFESKIDIEEAQYFDRYLDACKQIKGFSLDELSE